MKTYHYKAYGQVIRSELALPEFTEITKNTADIGAQIVFAELPEFKRSDRNAGMFRVHDGMVDLEIEDTVRIRIASDREIQIQILDESREREARLYLSGSGLGALSFLQGRFPFHCGLVVRNGAGFAFTGRSGAGKSTLTTALVRSGFGFMSDDVVLLDGSEPQVNVLSSFPRIKLWDDAMAEFDISKTGLEPLHYAENKFHIPFSDDQIVEKARLAGVFLIKYAPEDEGVTISKVSPHRALSILRENIYRPNLIRALDLEVNAFRLLTRLMRDVPIMELSRPRNLNQLDQVNEAVSHEIDRLQSSS